MGKKTASKYHDKVKEGKLRTKVYSLDQMEGRGIPGGWKLCSYLQQACIESYR